MNWSAAAILLLAVLLTATTAWVTVLRRQVRIQARQLTIRTELETQLRQAQKTEAIGRLAGGVAHDFNNTLTVIIGCAELAAAQLDAAHPARRDVEEIQLAAHRAASLTRQLLAFSRKTIVHPVVFDLNETIGHVNEMLRRLIGEHIELVIRPARDAARITADVNQIEHVILNLALNARDAMPDGGSLIIETGTTTLSEGATHSLGGPSPGEFVTLIVTDTGVGMTADVQARIFDPFFTTKASGHGTGLGLATVHGIVRQAGGGIAVESVVGRGTTFTIYLPRVTAPSEAPASRLSMNG